MYVYLAASVYDVHDDAPREAAGSALVDELRDRVRYLERQVEEEREARRRADTLLARLMDRVPELGPPEEQPEAPETVEEEREEAEPRSDAPGQQEVVRQQQAQRPTEGAEHDAGTLREWSGDVALRQPQEGAQRRPWWRRMFGG